MNIVYFLPLRGKVIDVDAVASRLTSRIPDGRITFEDHHVTERELFLRYLAPLREAEGKPQSQIQQMLDCADPKKRVLGFSKNVSIPLDADHVLSGDIRETGILFHTKALLSHPTCQLVVQFLGSLEGTITIYDREERYQDP